MKIFFKATFLIMLLFSLSSCGFKVVQNTNLNNFSIKEITSSGDRKISFKLKNNILNNENKRSENKILLDIKSQRIKTIKEKNIKNQITKYQINLLIDIKLTNSMGKQYLSQFSATDSYDVSSKHSTTINNERNLINSLIEDVGENILSEINIRIN